MSQLLQERLANLFKELVAGTKVLPIGVVNTEPGVFPVAHAPALLDAECNLCHACDQSASQKVVSSTKSATLVKPDEPNEASGHRDIQMGVTCSQLSWFDKMSPLTDHDSKGESDDDKAQPINVAKP